jgi:hypothetical protein
MTTVANRLTSICVLILAGPLVNAVNLRVREGRPIVDGVYVNGHGPYRFLVDTGSTLNHLEPRLAQSIGLKPTFRTELTSSAGVTVAAGATGIEVALDSARAEGQTFLFAGIEALHQLSSDLQGVLGQEFLSRFDYLLDLRGKRLEFGKPEVAFIPADDRRTRVQLKTVSGRPVVSTSLGALVLDSGTHKVTLFGVAATVLTQGMTTMSGFLKVGTVSRKLLIDGRTVWHGEAVAIPRPAETGVAGLLPVSLFKAVYVCNSEKYLVLD